MRSSVRRLIVPWVAAFTLVSTVFLSSVQAQDNPPPAEVTLPCATDVAIQLFSRTPVPDTTKDLVLARMIWQPGGGIGNHTHPGVLYVVVESGEFGFTLVDDMEMTVNRAATDATPSVAEPIVAGEEVVLNAGDGFAEMGMVHSARNLSDGVTTTIFSGLVEQGQPLTSCVE